MSLQAMLAVQKLGVQTSHASFRVLMTLAEHADKLGANSWPSVDTIAAEAQMDEKTVRRSLAKLEQDGLIAGDKRRGRGGVTIWRLLFAIPSLEKKEGTTPGFQEKEGITPGLMEPIPGTTPAFEDDKPGILSVKPGILPPEPVLNLSSKEVKEEVAPPSAPPPVKPDSRGTRLSPEWQPSSADAAYAAERGLDPAATTEDFRDYWHAKPGKDGRKSDWPGTWRTWCRREVKWHKPRATQPDVRSDDAVLRAAGLLPGIALSQRGLGLLQ